MRLLVTLDRSERDRIALRQAAHMAQATDGCIMLITVLAKTRALVPGTVREAEAYMHAVQTGLQEEHSLTSEAMTLRGDPATEITRMAHKLEVDVIIMVTRGRRGWDKVVLGSVAEAVLTHCSAPLLLLNEATSQDRLGLDVQRQSSYLAGVIWNKQARGVCSEEEANVELERLVIAGLDRDVLFGTYAALAKQGVASDLLDFDFQVRTLRKYLPAELDSVRRTDAA